MGILVIWGGRPGPVSNPPPRSVQIYNVDLKFILGAHFRLRRYFPCMQSCKPGSSCYYKMLAHAEPFVIIFKSG